MSSRTIEPPLRSVSPSLYCGALERVHLCSLVTGGLPPFGAGGNAPIPASSSNVKEVQSEEELYGLMRSAGAKLVVIDFSAAWYF